MLIVFGGLPGTGKTTISRLVARRLRATYLRIDTVEQAIRDAGVLAGDVGPSGYAAAQAVARDGLGLGLDVVADGVNPVAASRRGWREVATAAASPLLEVEIVCSDVDEHRRRVTTRASDIVGHAVPSWDRVTRLTYEPWDRPHLVIDTARRSAAEGADLVVAAWRA